MTRTVGHRLHEGAIEVYALARTLPEALALEAALKQVPKPEAFIPAPEPPELSPAQAAYMEAADPPEPVEVLNFDKAGAP